MTPRERTLAAVCGNPVDRVPRYDPTVASAVASRVVGRKVFTGGGNLRCSEAEARFRGEAAHGEWKDRFFDDYGDFINAVDYDLVRIPWRELRRPSRKTGEGEYLFETGPGEWERLKFDEASDTWHPVDFWNRGGESGLLREHLARHEREWQGPVFDERWREWVEDHRRLRLLFPERAVAANCAHCAVPLEPDWLKLLADDPGAVGRALDRQADEACLLIPLMVEAGVDIILGGGDCAFNKGPAYSPAMFLNLTVPRLRRISVCAESHGVPFVFKSDGNLLRFTDLIFGKDTGSAHGYAEIDFGAGMRLRALREKYPDLLLFGNVDGALLAKAPADEVRRHAGGILAEGKGHRHIFGVSNAVAPETPAENFLAMHQACAEFRLSPL